MLEDAQLVWRFNRGDREALRRIYEKYKDDLLTLSSALLNDATGAQDVVHDVFVDFAQSSGSFELTGSLKGYLVTCVANRARNQRRLNWRDNAGQAGTERSGSDLNEPGRSFELDEEARSLNLAMQQLPLEQREVIALHLQSGMKFKTIAKLHSASINTIQSRYRYGLKKLRSILDGKV